MHEELADGKPLLGDYAIIVPSLSGLPVATGLSHEEWLRESARFFDEAPRSSGSASLTP